MSKATGETEHLKDMLVGNILAVSKHDVIKTGSLRRHRHFPFHLPQEISGDFLSHNSAEPQPKSMSGCGLSLLCFVRLRCDLIGGDCRRAAGVLLPGGAVRRRNAICRPHWDAPGHRLDHGHAGFGFGVLLLRIL